MWLILGLLLLAAIAIWAIVHDRNNDDDKGSTNTTVATAPTVTTVAGVNGVTVTTGTPTATVTGVVPATAATTSTSGPDTVFAVLPAGAHDMAPVAASEGATPVLSADRVLGPDGRPYVAVVVSVPPSDPQRPLVHPGLIELRWTDDSGAAQRLPVPSG